MKLSKINLCYYPTTLILVDDQKYFLQDFKQRIDESLAYKLYDDPKKLLQDFSIYYPDYFVERCNIAPDEEQQANENVSYEVNLREIHKEIYNPKRFEQISVLIADYAMPGINGLDCCKAIENKYIKKILLTGEADNDLAVKAFNEGIINKFILKNTPNLSNLVNQAIFELQAQYFSDLSENIYNTALSQGKLPKFLNDESFISLFNQKCQEFNIVEYYILDNQGSFLMLDQDANPYWLIVKSETEIENLYQFGAIENPTSNMAGKLKQRKEIPYFYSNQDFETPPSQWEKYMHPAEQLEGKEIYYAFLRAPKMYPLEIEKIYPYRKYLKKVKS